MTLIVKSRPSPTRLANRPPPISNLACPNAITANQCQATKRWILNQNLGTYPRLLRQDVELIKLDYQLNASNHVSGLVNIRDWKIPNGTAIATVNNTGILSASQPTFNQNRFFIGTWNLLIGSSMVNEARFHWGQDHNFTEVSAAPPQTQLSSIFTHGPQGSIPGYTDERRTQLSDNFSFTKGA